MKTFLIITCCLIILAFGQASMAQNKSARYSIQFLTSGKKLYDKGAFQTASDSIEKAATLLEDERDFSNQLRALHLFGDCQAILNHCEKAEEIFKRAFQLASKQFKPDSPEMAETYYYLGRSAGCSRKHEEGIANLKKSIQLKRTLNGEGIEVAYDYTYIGYLFTNMGLHDSAHHYLDKALRIREKSLSPDDIELAHTLYNLGRNFENQYELGKALEFHTRALKIRMAKLDPGHESLSHSLHQLGSAYQKLGNYDRALEYCQMALDISIKAFGQVHTNVVANYYTIGNLHGFMFNYPEAIRYIKEGNSVYEQIYGDKSDILPTYEAYLGRLYGFIGEHDAALKSFKQAQSHAEKNLTPNHAYLGIVYNIIGDYYSVNNDQALAQNYFDKAIRIFKSSMGNGSVREADVLGRMGLMNVKSKNFKKAHEHYQFALDIYLSKMGSKNSKVASLYQYIGEAYLEQSDFQKALTQYQKAFESVSTGFKDTLVSNPTIDQLDNKPMALQIVKKKAFALAKASKANHSLNDLKLSLTNYLYAIELIDDISIGYNLESAKVELEKESRSIYSSAIQIAYQLYLETKDNQFVQDGFLISEKSKSSMLLENIRDREAKTFAGVPDSLIDKERDYKIEIAFIQSLSHSAMNKKDTVSMTVHEKDLFAVQQKYDKLKEKLKRNFPSYYHFKFDQEKPSLKSVQRSLSRGGLLVEFFVADSAIYKFTISENQHAFEEVESGRKLTQLMDDYERSLTSTDLILNSRAEADKLYTTTANALYKTLLESSLKNNKTPITKLVIVPDDRLSQFNFGTLLTKPSSTEFPDYKNLDYLSKQYPLSYSYSAMLVAQASTSKTKAKNIFAGYAPSYSADQFISLDSIAHPMAQLTVRSGNLPLPGAMNEVRQLTKLMEGDSWIDKKASETNFKMNASEYSVLHLAMHSLLNNENSNLSELLFNHEEDLTNDGFLTISEIYNLKLNASLVVLSACSSGYGKIQKGEGPISLSRAFSYAGCPSVVMSLWKIPDDVTSQLMANFYEQLKNGKEKDEALRLAQIKLLSETKDPLYQHPYFWSGFVVMGSTQALPDKFPWWMVYGGIGGGLLLIFFFLGRRRV
jgi:CHAT domain-containing protein